MPNREWFIIIGSILACVIIFCIEQFLPFDYFGKTVSKLFLFIVIPLSYWHFNKNRRGKEETPGRINWSSVAVGIIAFYVVYQSFLLFQHLIDVDMIKDQLNDKNITMANFILIGVYIVVGNSFIEELFFRGFIFLNLYRMNKKMTAYMLSSLLFSLYHVGIFLTWFDLEIVLLITAGLFIAGLIFNFLNSYTSTIVNSWIVHASADAAIVIIGIKFIML